MKKPYFHNLGKYPLKKTFLSAQLYESFKLEPDSMIFLITILFMAFDHSTPPTGKKRSHTPSVRPFSHTTQTRLQRKLNSHLAIPNIPSIQQMPFPHLGAYIFARTRKPSRLVAIASPGP
jgi:hypothetical protein